MNCNNDIYPDIDLRRWSVCQSFDINLSDYYTKNEIDEKLSGITTDGINEEEAQDLIDSSLEGYATEEWVDGQLLNKLDASAYTPTDLSGYYNKQETDALLSTKLDASAYTPTDLSGYYTKIETQEAINAATSGIPSSSTIDGLRSDLNALSGDVIDNEEVVSRAVNSLNDRVAVLENNSGGSSTDLSNYYNKSEVDGLLSNKANASDLSALNTTVGQLSTQMSNKANASDLNNYYSKTQIDALIALLQAQIDDLMDCCSGGSSDSGSTSDGNKWVVHISGGTEASLACDDPRDNMHNMIGENEFVHAQYGPFNTSSEYSSVTSVEVGECVVGIMDNAFSGFTNMTAITVDDSVVHYGINAFGDCESLASFPYTSTLEDIGGSAFAHCYSLTSVTMPSTVTSIGQWAFQDCTGLTSVTMEGSTPPTLGNYAFYNEYGTEQLNITIYVPANAVNTYKQASGWSDYSSKIQAMP